MFFTKITLDFSVIFISRISTYYSAQKSFVFLSISTNWSQTSLYNHVDKKTTNVGNTVKETLLSCLLVSTWMNLFYASYIECNWTLYLISTENFSAFCHYKINANHAHFLQAQHKRITAQLCLRLCTVWFISFRKLNFDLDTSGHNCAVLAKNVHNSGAFSYM